MSQFFTSNSIIASVKRRAMIPTNQSTFTDDDFLAFANEEISLGLLPSILRLREDYYLYSEDVAMVDSQSNYTIPHRSIGNKLRDVAFKDNNGNVMEMTRINIQDIPEFVGSSSTSKPYTYYIQNNQVILHPAINGSVSGSLVFNYYLRPNELVTEDKVSTITNINFNTGVVTVDQIPTAFTNNTLYDMIQAKSPFVSLALSKSAVIDGTLKTITFGTYDTNTVTYSGYATITDGDYLTLTDISGSLTYIYWYNKSGTATESALKLAGTIPDDASYVYVEVDISGDASDAAVAITTDTAISISGISTSYVSEVLTVARDSIVGSTFNITSSFSEAAVVETIAGVSILPSTLAVGDYINVECECIVPQVPADLHVVLAHRVAARCLEALGDTEGLSNANKKLAEMEDKTTNLIDSRVEESPKKIVNRHGILRAGLTRKRWNNRG